MTLPQQKAHTHTHTRPEQHAPTFWVAPDLKEQVTPMTRWVVGQERRSVTVASTPWTWGEEVVALRRSLAMNCP